MQQSVWPERQIKRPIALWVWNLVGLFVFLVLWFVATDVLKLYKPYVIPPLLGEQGILIEFTDNPAMWKSIPQSIMRIAIGYGTAVALGSVVGMILSISTGLRGIVGGWLTAIQSVPSIAFVPLAILWFGLNEKAVYFVVILEGFIPVALAISSSLANVSPSLRIAGRTLGAKGLGLYLKVLLPASLPSLTTALRTSWSFAWRALIGGELLTSNQGIGQLLETGRNTSNSALVIATIFVIGTLGILMDSVMRTWETTIRRNYGLEVNA